MSSKPRAASRSRPRWLWPAIIALVALVALGWWWSKREARNPESAYRTTPIERGDIRVAISATGTLSAISTVTVGSQISGQVTDVLVDFNSPVKKGEVLASPLIGCVENQFPRMRPWKRGVPRPIDNFNLPIFSISSSAMRSAAWYVGMPSRSAIS